MLLTECLQYSLSPQTGFLSEFDISMTVNCNLNDKISNVGNLKYLENSSGGVASKMGFGNTNSNLLQFPRDQESTNKTSHNNS